jgi:hypothetical protein
MLGVDAEVSQQLRHASFCDIVDDLQDCCDDIQDQFDQGLGEPAARGGAAIAHRDS